MTKQLTQSEQISITKQLEEVIHQLSTIKRITAEDSLEEDHATKPMSTMAIQIPYFMTDSLTTPEGYKDYYLVHEIVLILPKSEARRIPSIEGTDTPDITKVMASNALNYEPMELKAHRSERNSHHFTFDFSEIAPSMDMNEVLLLEAVPIKQRWDSYLMRYGILSYHLDVGVFYIAGD